MADVVSGLDELYMYWNRELPIQMAWDRYNFYQNYRVREEILKYKLYLETNLVQNVNMQTDCWGFLWLYINYEIKY